MARKKGKERKKARLQGNALSSKGRSRRALFSPFVKLFKSIKESKASEATRAVIDKLPMSRRRFFTWMGIGATSIGSFLLFKQPILRWVVRKLEWHGKPFRASIGLAFHSGKANADYFIRLMKEAAERKEPYHILALEDAEMTFKRAEKNVKAMEKEFHEIQKYVVELRAEGRSNDEIVEIIFKGFPKSPKGTEAEQMQAFFEEFIYRIQAGAAVYGLRPRFAELYTEKEVAHLKSITDKEKAWERKVMKTPLLKDRIEPHFQFLLALKESSEIREKRMAERIPALFTEEKDKDPSLAREPHIRLLAPIGGGHFPLVHRLTAHPLVEAVPHEEHPDTMLLGGMHLRDIKRIDISKPFGRLQVAKDYMHGLVVGFYFRLQSGGLKVNFSKAISEMNKVIHSMTLNEFEKLSKAIGNHPDKEKLIFEYFLKKYEALPKR